MTDELSPSQAAARIGTSTRSVQRWIAAGRLPARRVGGRFRVASDALDAFVLALGPGTMLSGASSPSQPGKAPAEGIRTLFVANRGEIARRIRQTCQRLGIRAIVPGDDDAPSVDLLDPDALVAAARTAGADALHPGYGFLAENADFAIQVVGAGIRWIGPPAEAIRAMGDKAAARRLATSLEVPIIPGYDDPDQGDKALSRAAAAIGVPLLVKPAGGGGGKGIRIVRDLATLPDALASARREARTAFSDDRLILERFLEGPRHVEVQVLFDASGNGVHFGERDCSIQRRHQKILEETPSPAVSDELRERLGAAALALGRAVGYVSAGTCEFLLDDRGQFFFLEMNARLQVEHPVTELVTGRDLVADQIRIAQGEPLGFNQADADTSRRQGGHAIEVRLYAEDADSGFLPATGRVEALAWPSGSVAFGPVGPSGIRVDAGIDLGTRVGSRFDPMLAKVIAHGRDRSEALARLAGALDETIVLGLTTNLRFLRWLVRQPVLVHGETRIDTLDRIWPPERWSEQTTVPDAAWQAAARRLAGHQGTGALGANAGWRLNARARVRLTSDDGNERMVEIDDSAGTGEPVAALGSDGAVHVDVGGRSVRFRLVPPPDVDRAFRAAAAHHPGGPADVVAPMPGSVLAVHVAIGAVVEAGDPIVTLEAMKMEHVVAATGPGTILDVAVHPTDQVTRGQVLATVE